MGKHIFVNGNLLVTTGTLYTRNISAGGSWHPDDAVIVTPENGVLEITEEAGSIFDSYYVSGWVTSGGFGNVGIKSYCDIYEFTINQYENGLKLIKGMLGHVPTGECGRLYCQQQFASVFSLMEQFLSCTFVKQTCDREESYRNVLSSGLLQQKYRKQRHILNGPDCLQKELVYIDTANSVVYHRHNSVKELFHTAFGIEVDLTPLEEALKTRNNIMHRFGQTTSGLEVIVRVEDVEALINTVDSIVHETARQITALTESERMYPDRK